MENLLNIQLFADAGTVVNGTESYVNAYTGDKTAFSGTNDLSAGMKTYYDTELLTNTRSQLIFKQLGKPQPLPKNHGKTVEWRKWNTFDKAMTPLQEGVIPTGQKFGMSAKNVTVKQYGDYTSITDQLELHAVDNVILSATEEMGAAAGETQDALVRNELMKGTNVIYCDTVGSDGSVSAPSGRWQMKADNNRLTPDMVNKAYTWLKKQKAPKFEGGKYVAVIHPSVAYDLRSSDGWIEAHKYSAATEIFNGEIGELHNVRFVETTNAKIDSGKPLCEATDFITVASYSGEDVTESCDKGITSPYMVTVNETITDDIVGRLAHVYDASATGFVGTVEICGATASGKKIWLTEAPPVALAASDTLYPGEGGDCKEAGQAGVAVYSTLFFGAGAFGVVDPAGGGMEMIVKDKSQIGGPLNQFSTIGYKFEDATKILYEDRMVRVESCSAYSLTDEEN